MPSFVNVGAYVDSGTMVDTWATVGSCAQIGKNCHLSGGVDIGGVLKPLQAEPVIIEDNCFIGARSEVVEGVVVEEGGGAGNGYFYRRHHQDRRSGDRRDQNGPRSGLLDRRAELASGQAATRWEARVRASIAPSSSRRSSKALAPEPRSTSCCPNERMS
jgi:hypothetical protein